MSDLEVVLEQITNNLDRRRFDLTSVKRVVFGFVGKQLESKAVEMAIPMIYANWEGYIKEVCQIYLEYVESAVPQCSQLKPVLLGHLWTPILRPLTGGLNPDRIKIVAEAALNLKSPVAFSNAEKAVDTKSNLNFRVLERISTFLCLDISALVGWKPHLDALVHLRNNIAHGSPPNKMTLSDFDQHVSSTITLMEDFENVLISSMKNGVFCTV